MAAVRFSAQFREDFRGVIERLARLAGVGVATDYAARIRLSVRQLNTHPGIGAPRGKFGRNIRMLVVEPYLIFYEGGPKAREVTVLRLVDGRRRITRRTIARGREQTD